MLIHSLSTVVDRVKLVCRKGQLSDDSLLSRITRDGGNGLVITELSITSLFAHSLIERSVRPSPSTEEACEGKRVDASGRPPQPQPSAEVSE